MSKTTTQVKTEKKHWWQDPITMFGLFLFVFLIFVDQITKAVADAYFNSEDAPFRIIVIEDWINLCIAYNRGISYGLGTNAPTWAKIAVIAFTGVLMLVFLVVFFKLDSRRTWMKIALIFVVAGGVGNLIDRLYYQVWDPTTVGGVRDMVDLSAFGFAVCNFADFFICGGAVALVLGLLFFDQDAIFPLGKYKELAREASEKEALKKAKKAAQRPGKPIEYINEQDE